MNSTFDIRSAILGTLAALLIISAVFFVPWRLGASGELVWAPAYRQPITFERTYDETGEHTRLRYAEGEVAVGILIVQTLTIAAVGGAAFVMSGGGSAAGVLLVAMLAGTPSAVAQEATEPDSMASIDLPAEFERVLRDYERHWQDGDAEALAGLFTADGFILRPGHPPTRGRSAIEAAYATAAGPLRLRALAYEASDSLAYVVGAYRYGPEAPDRGKFVLTLRRGEDARWYIAVDMDNAIR